MVYYVNMTNHKLRNELNYATRMSNSKRNNVSVARYLCYYFLNRKELFEHVGCNVSTFKQEIYKKTINPLMKTEDEK